MQFIHEKKDESGDLQTIEENDWFVAEITKLSGKWADVNWENGDPHLWMDISDSNRGKERRWVLLKPLPPSPTV